MVTINGKRIYLYNKEVSFRLGIDGLTSLIYTDFSDKEILNGIFVFFNKNHRQVKLIEYDDKGTWMYQKKLYNRKFIVPDKDGEYINISKAELKVIFDSVRLLRRRS